MQQIIQEVGEGGQEVLRVVKRGESRLPCGEGGPCTVREVEALVSDTAPPAATIQHSGSTRMDASRGMTDGRLPCLVLISPHFSPPLTAAPSGQAQGQEEEKGEEEQEGEAEQAGA